MRLWLAFLTGLIMQAAMGNPAHALDCSGTEPFWSLKIGGGKIVLDEANTGKTPLLTVAPRAAQGRPADLVRVYQTRTLGPNRQYVTIVIRKADNNSCSDGMSDTAYPYSAIVIRPAGVLEGCCKW
ncbi:MAG: hypothetical protein U1E49_04280 [Hyphomicrobiaceae bacterium]